MNTNLKKKNIKSKFIILEGGEGSGKSTQIKKIKNLSQNNINSCLTRESGGNIQAELIRNILFNNKIKKWDYISEYLLISAARRQHLKHIVWPALAKGKWVICDRFYDSSIIYQGYAHGLSLTFLNTIYKKIAGNFKADLTIFMNINTNHSIKRTRKRITQINSNYYENMNLKFHNKLNVGYNKLINKKPHEYIKINANAQIETVWKSIEYNLIKKFKLIK